MSLRNIGRSEFNLRTEACSTECNLIRINPESFQTRPGLKILTGIG